MVQQQQLRIFIIIVCSMILCSPSSSSSAHHLQLDHHHHHHHQNLPCSPSDLSPLQAFHASLPSPHLLPWPVHNSSCCLWLGISCNFHGHVISLHLPSIPLSSPFPSHLLLLPHLLSFNLSNTLLHGFLPHSLLPSSSSLSILDLSHNPFLSGPFPSLLPPSLTHLDLSHCSLHGPIPFSISQSPNIHHLLIHHNFFSDLGPGVSALSHLQILEASANRLTDSSVLRNLSNLTELHTLNLDGNRVGGVVPPEIGNLGNLRILRLRKNGLVGSIPPEIVKCRKLEELWLDDNFLHGTIPGPMWELPCLTVLSLSNNRLEGNLPSSIPESSILRVLSLSENMLSGEIPEALTRLPHLEVLLLARNRFSGVLLSPISSLKQVDVTGNRLENAWLGDNVRTIPIRQTDLQHVRRQLRSAGVSKSILTGILSGVAAFVGILVIGIVTFLICRYKAKPRHGTRSIGPSIVVHEASLSNVRKESSSVFDPSLSSIRYSDLVKATNGFDKTRIVGDGGFGYVYTATLSDGRTVAVKKLDEGGIQGQREFEAEMQTLGKIRHPNLVELMAYCSVGNERLLVYEFAENGSLDTLLHEGGNGSVELNWRVRMKIAQGTARGLAYLHHECDPHVLHRDIKSSNILLGKDLEPKIADFGFARNISIFKSHVTTVGAGTLGYMAPEYCANPVATRQADVYSFGMLLLELATGRRPGEPVSSKKFRTLIDWTLKMIRSGSEMKLLDPVLLKDPPSYADVTAYFIIACECTSETPRSRPRMKDVYERLSLLL